MLIPKLKNSSSTTSTRPSIEIEVFENPKEWLKDFQAGWLHEYEKTGQFNWQIYPRPHNRFAPSGPGVALASSRLLLITSAGAYLPASQPPFDSANPLGDYTTRQLPVSSAFHHISFAHQNIDRQFLQADPQVALPLHHLADLVQQGIIGDLALNMVSFMGYQPNILRVAKELIPDILKIAKAQQVDAALIIPVGPLCIQSAGLVARALEINGLATVLTSWDLELTQVTAPPRYTITSLPSGSPLGAPHDSAQQRRVLEATLALLEKDSPTGHILSEERFPN
ncbi:MAG: glycine/sarcosine/betaine reductase selenoprotein B family protein [Anaerolineae bacterium]|nr:glycine/sarcosine/betaine reductase selenoprotein B family protein [Anaerolineae bacterium]